MGVEGTEQTIDMRQRIMGAAEMVFAQKDFAAASISEICATAGVNRALIYYYFKDKEDLYNAVLAGADACMMRIAEEALSADGTAFDKLRHFLTNSSRMVIERQSLIRVVMRRDFSIVPDLAAVDRYSGPQIILARIIREGMAAGQIRQTDPERTAHLLTGMVFSLAFMHLSCPAMTPADNIEYAMRMLTRGMAR